MNICGWCPAVDWHPISDVYSHLEPSIPGIGSGSSVPMMKIKCPLKMNEMFHSGQEDNRQPFNFMVLKQNRNWNVM